MIEMLEPEEVSGFRGQLCQNENDARVADRLSGHDIAIKKRPRNLNNQGACNA